MKTAGTVLICLGVVLTSNAFSQNPDINGLIRKRDEARAASEEFLARPSTTQDFREAAESGDAFSQWSLGLAYESGQGVPQNYMRAYVWYSVAAAQGGDLRELAADSRDVVGTYLAATDLVAAQALATKCFESEYKDCD